MGGNHHKVKGAFLNMLGRVSAASYPYREEVRVMETASASLADHHKEGRGI